MEPRWLEAFIALAEVGSIRAAAARLGISPSTLSAYISALEEHLGVALFDRSAGGSVLSERGRAYLPDADQLLKSWNRITTQIHRLNETPSARLRMIVQGHVMPPPPLEAFLKTFLSRHYHVVPEIYDDREHGIEDSLHRRAVDLYFAFCPPSLNLPGIAHQTVYSTRLCALIPSGHSLAKREAVSLAELDGETLFLAPETKDSYLRIRQLDALQAAGIRYFTLDGHPNPRLQSMLVCLERGIAILPHSQCFSVQGQAAVVPLTDPLCQCSMEMLYLTDNDNPALWQFLREYNSTEGGVWA